MEKQEINITSINKDTAVIEEKMTYERNVKDLKNELANIDFRKQSIIEEMKRLKRQYEAEVSKEKTITDAIKQLGGEENIDDLMKF